MNQTTPNWDAWSADWQSESSPQSTALRQRLAHELAKMRRAAALQTALIGAVAVGIVIDLTHAPAAADLVRGALVLVLLGIVAIVVRTRRRSDDLDMALPTQDFTRARQHRLRAQFQTIYVAWAVIALELAFLIPWWIDGWAVHAGSFRSMKAVWAGWLQAAATVAVLVWTMRLYSRARAEQAQIEGAHNEEPK